VLQALMSDTKPSQLQHELSKAPGTRDKRVAKKAAAAAVAKVYPLPSEGSNRCLKKAID